MYSSLMNMSSSEILFIGKIPPAITPVQVDFRVEFSDENQTPTASSSEEEKFDTKDDDDKEVKEVDENDDGFRTPTSLEHKIPKCPPAPKKRKTLPLSTKRKAPSDDDDDNDRVLRIDLSKEELDMLFPPALLVDFGRKIKKAKGDKY